MNKKIKLAALFALVIFTLSSCDNALHNGTQMLISKVVLTGLPADKYPAGKEMIFSFSDGTTWNHDIYYAAATRDTLDTKFISTVDANGTLTYNFDVPLVVKTPQLVFLLAATTENWGLKIASNQGMDAGNDVSLDNKWSGDVILNVVEGTVSGDDVTWVYEGD